MWACHLPKFTAIEASCSAHVFHLHSVPSTNAECFKSGSTAAGWHSRTMGQGRASRGADVHRGAAGTTAQNWNQSLMRTPVESEPHLQGRKRAPLHYRRLDKACARRGRQHCSTTPQQGACTRAAPPGRGRA